MRIFLSFILCGLFCGLVGCSLWQKPEPTPPPALSPLMQFMSEHSNGDSTTVDDDTFGPQITVTMQDAFTSAAGEQCRRATLLNKSGQTEIIVICQQTRDGVTQWVMAPRIWGQGVN